MSEMTLHKVNYLALFLAIAVGAIAIAAIDDIEVDHPEDVAEVALDQSSSLGAACPGGGNSAPAGSLASGSF